MEKPKKKTYYEYSDVLQYIIKKYNLDVNSDEVLKEALAGNDVENGHMFFVDLDRETYSKNVKNIINCLKEAFPEETSYLQLRYSW